MMVKNSSSRLRNSRGVILLGAIGLAFFLSILIGGALMRSTNQQMGARQRVDSHQSFYSAESGIERALFELRKDPLWQPTAADQNVAVQSTQGANRQTEGFYSLQAVAGNRFQAWDTVWIRSSGWDSARLVPRVIDARIVKINPAQFLVLTFGDLRFGSGTSVDFDVFGRDIIFEVNDSLPSPQKDININGNILYLRNVNGQSHPAVHLNAQSTITQAPSMTFANLDLTRYKNLAISLEGSHEGVYHSGSAQLDLDSVCGSTVPPKIIYAEGDIEVRGRYSCSILVVSAGNVSIAADVEARASAHGILPQIGLFADKDVYIADFAAPPDADLNVEAFILANGSGASDGKFAALGPKSSRGALNFKGAISARGDAGRTAVDLNVFRQRNYVFNPDLSQNNSIPFSPFLANILEWREVNPTDPFPLP